MLSSAWSLLRLALLALVCFLAIGCLTQAGKSVASLNAAGGPVAAHVCHSGTVRVGDVVQRRPDGADGPGHCAKQALPENSSIGPAAASTRVASALSPEETGGSPGAVGQRNRCGPLAPPDVGRLCVLRV
ncbi:hypothetical protein [Actinomadura harenae]|uniref:Uncharacterized protein n=1 Tax=Actinomadura harenae TaxID=2483351 RepID=A0A3M2M1K5_9ACTN|nr:hypothetical protein [Actinomadura harenae]RMI42950.1 hypothetical protein EBO15_18185 [Actinomadura harenae]